jgi:hypothetical protein
MAKPVHGTLETLSWEALPHVAYSPDLAPYDYHLIALMLAEQCYCLYKDLKNGYMNGLQQMGKIFYWHRIHKFSKRWEKCITSNGAYFE